MNNHYVKIYSLPINVKLNPVQLLIWNILQSEGLMDIEQIWQDIKIYCRSNQVLIPSFNDILSELHNLVKAEYVLVLEADVIKELIKPKVPKQETKQIVDSYYTWL